MIRGEDLVKQIDKTLTLPACRQTFTRWVEPIPLVCAAAGVSVQQFEAGTGQRFIDFASKRLALNISTIDQIVSTLTSRVEWLQNAAGCQYLIDNTPLDMTLQDALRVSWVIGKRSLTELNGFSSSYISKIERGLSPMSSGVALEYLLRAKLDLNDAVSTRDAFHRAAAQSHSA